MMKSVFQVFLKVSKFQNEFMKSSFLPKYEWGQKFFAHILGEMMTSEIYSEIYWPLVFLVFSKLYTNILFYNSISRVDTFPWNGCYVLLQNTSALYCSSFTFQYRIVCTVVVQQRNNMMQNFFHQLSIIISLVVGRISSTSTSIKWENNIEWWRLYYRGSYTEL